MIKFYVLHSDERTITTFKKKMEDSTFYISAGSSKDPIDLNLQNKSLLETDLLVFEAKNLEDIIRWKEIYSKNRLLEGKSDAIAYAMLLDSEEEMYDAPPTFDDVVDLIICADWTWRRISCRTDVVVLTKMKEYLSPTYRKEIMEGIDIPGFDAYLNAILREFALNPNLAGYRYLKTSIELSFLSGNNIYEGKTKVLYPTVGAIYSTDSSRVQRAMRHVIDTHWDKGNIEKSFEIFCYTINSASGKPTVSEFVANIVDYLMIKYRKDRYVYLSENATKMKALDDLKHKINEKNSANPKMRFRHSTKDLPGYRIPAGNIEEKNKRRKRVEEESAEKWIRSKPSPKNSSEEDIIKSVEFYD